MKTISKDKAEKKLISILPNDVKILACAFNASGFQLFLVGGCIRDVFTGKTPKDFDVCTNAMPNQVIEILKNNNITFQLQGESFGVVVAKMSEDFEIATFRSDVDSGTGINNETIVTLGVTIEEDVKRRDLTINALFMDITNETIIDLVGGINDIRTSVIRTVGKPEDRFAEDHLRKLRAIVRAVKTNFIFDTNTFNSIKNNPTLNVAEERIFIELDKVDSNFSRLKSLLFISNLINSILPNLKLTAIDTIKEHNLDFMFANILKNEDPKTLFKSLNKLKFPNKLNNNICFLVTLMNTDLNQMNPLDFLKGRAKTDILTLEYHQMFDFHNSKNKNMTALLDFENDSNVSQEFMSKGFTGKELGDAISAHFFKNRTNIF
jgi:tRNA nucleotidyltransferase/poly(A) polymerase